MTGWRKRQIADMVNEAIETMPNNPEKYSDEYDAFYNEETNEWLESKCDDPTCHYCQSRPEKPLEELASYDEGVRRGADAMAREIDREVLEQLKRHDWEAAVKKMNKP